MRYDRYWLDGIYDTRKLIEAIKSRIDNIPFPHKGLIKQQFDIATQSFSRHLENGLNTSTDQQEIRELAQLVLDLIEEGEKRCAEFS